MAEEPREPDSGPEEGDDQAERPTIEHRRDSDPMWTPASEGATMASGPPTGTPRGAVNVMPEQVGPYRPIRLLGEGGFGYVFLAEQFEPVRRRVALKMIKPSLGSVSVLGRFEAERQA
ncbi:MAG: hypothetical protein KDA21_13560, partial [Phycisphaerales bacterium]|nr:hypothetical protein [Phycisphaerales bacterium]